MNTTNDAVKLARLLTEVRNNHRFWPDEETFQLSHQILPVPATEVAVVKDGKLLLSWRSFEEWKAPYKKPGWYLPGGYVPWATSIESSCLGHLLKDMKNEYKLTGINFDPLGFKLTLTAVIGQKKWMPLEHPFGAPLSVICVCELTSGTIIETARLKWSDETIPTDVPHHQKFQDLVFAWMKTSPEFKAEQARLAQLLD